MQPIRDIMEDEEIVLCNQTIHHGGIWKRRSTRHCNCADNSRSSSLKINQPSEDDIWPWLDDVGTSPARSFYSKSTLDAPISTWDQHIAIAPSIPAKSLRNISTISSPLTSRQSSISITNQPRNMHDSAESTLTASRKTSLKNSSDESYVESDEESSAQGKFLFLRRFV